MVDLTAEIEETTFGGVGVTHTGTVGANATLLTKLDVIWETEESTEVPVTTTAPTEAPVETLGPEESEPVPDENTKDADAELQAGQTEMPWIMKYMIASLAGVVLLAVIAAIYVTVKGRKK